MQLRSNSVIFRLVSSCSQQLYSRTSLSSEASEFQKRTKQVYICLPIPLWPQLSLSHPLFRTLWTLWMTVSPQDLIPWASPRGTASSSESKSGCAPMRSTATSKTEVSNGPSSARRDLPTSSKDSLETAGELLEQNTVHPSLFSLNSSEINHQQQSIPKVK